MHESPRKCERRWDLVRVEHPSHYASKLSHHILLTKKMCKVEDKPKRYIVALNRHIHILVMHCRPATFKFETKKTRLCSLFFSLSKV